MNDKSGYKYKHEKQGRAKTYRKHQSVNFIYNSIAHKKISTKKWKSVKIKLKHDRFFNALFVLW